MSKYSVFKSPLDVQLETAEKIKKLRKLEKYSQANLAERSGVSLGSLKRFERTGQISLESLIKLANVFGRLDDFNSLFQINDDMKRIEKLFSKLNYLK